MLYHDETRVPTSDCNFVAQFQRSLSYSEDECSQIKNGYDKSENDVRALMNNHEQVNCLYLLIAPFLLNPFCDLPHFYLTGQSASHSNQPFFI